MAIIVKLDDILHARRTTLTELSERVGITLANLATVGTITSGTFSSAVSGATINSNNGAFIWRPTSSQTAPWSDLCPCPSLSDRETAPLMWPLSFGEECEPPEEK